MKRFVYADNAATTKLDIDAFEAMKPFLLEEYGNASQPYSFGRKAKKALKIARNIIANCINAEPEEIYFTSGGTESDNWAIKSAVSVNTNKQVIITSKIEHHAVLRACEFVEKLGCDVVYLPVTEEGVVATDFLSSTITPSTHLVSIMLANNEIGTIQPVKELCEIAHTNGALFHTDAVQALGHIKIDVKELGVDLLSASAHKFNGPKGIGFLYVKKGVSISPYLHGGDQEFGFRAGTENIAAIVGMASALKKNCDSITENIYHINQLESRFIERISSTSLKFVRNGGAHHIPGNISISFYDSDGEALLHRLDLMGVCVSAGAACDSVHTQISHVLNALGVSPDLAKGTIRISLGRDNTIDDVDYIVDALNMILLK